MAGWFYAPIPQPQQLAPSVAPEDTAVGATNPIVGVIPRTNVLVRSAWGQESWSAQTGATVASKLATPVLMNAPLPFRRASVFDPTYRWFESSYSLYFPPASVSGITVQQISPPQSTPVSVYSIAAIRSSWPQPQWDAQAESTLASIFAPVTNAVQVPASPTQINQALISQTWPQPEWKGQSESAAAGGFAPIQPGPQFVSQQATQAALLQNLWPQPVWGPQTAPHSLAWLPAPITAIPAPVPHNEILSWPCEQWNAQSGVRIAGQLSSVQQQIPPPPVNAVAGIVAQWPRDQWSAQTESGIASGLASVVPPAFVPKAPAQTSIVGLWSQPNWSSQSAGSIASLFALTPPAQAQTGPAVQNTQWLWPQESWKAQGSPTTAALLAQLQVAALFVPNSTSDSIALITSTWPQESWTTQRSPLGAAWIQLLAPVAAQPAPPPHIERLHWQQEQWSSQASPRIASQFATANQSQPKPPVQQQIVSIWPTEQWPAQQSAQVASQFALVFDIPFIPTPLRTTEILSWAPEQWKAQTGAEIASTLVSIPIPVVPAPVATLDTVRFSWTPENWDHQRGARNAAAFAPAPPVVPFISIPQRTQLVSSWPMEQWSAQQAPNGAYISANVQPPPPPPPVTPRTPQKPANLGYKVTTRDYNLLEMVQRAWGGEFRQPDHRVYEFSNGRAFDSTDQGTTGIYRKK